MFNFYILILLVINLCIAAGYFLWKCFVKKDIRKGVIVSLFLLLVPVIGVIFIVCTKIVDFLFYWKRNKSIDTSDFSFSKERSRMIISDDIDKESDKVPLEEAFMISDSMNRRTAFLEILKNNDSEDYILQIRRAMRNDDSEVVHYAATYITDTIAKYKEDELKLRKICENNSDEEIYLTYLHYCEKMLSSHILSEPDELLYLSLYELYLDRLYTMNKNKVDPCLIIRILDLYKIYKKDDLRVKWITRMRDYIDQDINAAKEVLKYYFEIHDNEQFFTTLEYIKQSPLELDAELIEWIRMFK